MTVHACVAARIGAPGRALARAAAALVPSGSLRALVACSTGARLVLGLLPRLAHLLRRLGQNLRHVNALVCGAAGGRSVRPAGPLVRTGVRRCAAYSEPGGACSRQRVAGRVSRRAHPLRAQPAARRRGGLRRVKRCRSDEQLSAHYASETGGGGARPGASCRRCRASGRHACGAAVGARRASFQPKVCCPAVAARALAGSIGGAAAPRHHAPRASRATHPPGARPGPQHDRQRRTRGQPPRAP